MHLDGRGYLTAAQREEKRAAQASTWGVSDAKIRAASVPRVCLLPLTACCCAGCPPDSCSGVSCSRPHTDLLVLVSQGDASKAQFKGRAVFEQVEGAGGEEGGEGQTRNGRVRAGSNLARLQVLQNPCC